MKKLIISLTFLFINLSIAEVTMYEQEPNNTPINGNKFKGSMVVLGNMQGKDQDMFIWEVSDVDAGFLWDIEVDGLPDSLTKFDFMQLTFTEDSQGVTKVNKLFSINNYVGINSVKKRGLILNPGTYYIGLSYAGGKNNNVDSPLFSDDMLKNLEGEYAEDNIKINQIKVTPQSAYQIKFVKGKKLTELKTKDNSKDKPAYLRERSFKSLYFDTKTKWVSIHLNGKDIEKVWEISGNVSIGEKLLIKFYNNTGELKTTTKSDSYGHYSLPDLKLPEGYYLLELNSRENAVISIEMHETGLSIEDQESEPNDYFRGGNPIKIGQTLSGKMGKNNESDFFKFDITEELSQNQLEINLTNSQETSLEMCLYDDKKYKLQCKTNKGNIDLVQLVLSAGSYGLSVARGKLDTHYAVEIVSKGKIKSINEAEPNDRYLYATAMNGKRIIKGKLVGLEEDFFKFEVGKDPKMWTIQAIGDSITRLNLYNSAGKSVQEQRFTKGTKRARLSNLQLMPGNHVVRVYGEDSKYLLRVFPTGPVDKSFEAEPNDHHTQAMNLEFNQTKKGLLQNLIDKDLYRFHLNNEQGVHLIITPPSDAHVQYYLQWEGMSIGKKKSKLGETLEYKGVLAAGDYGLQINAHTKASDDIYEVSLEYYDASACNTDCEPNDSVHQANLINAPMILKGHTGTHKDYDWYKLPAFETETRVTFQNMESKDNYDTRAYVKFDKIIKAIFDREKKTTSFLIPANEESYYNLGLVDQPYHYSILLNNKEVEKPKVYKGLSISIKNLPSKVMAYNSVAQNLTAELIIENTGTEPQSFDITSHSSDHRWNIVLENKKHELHSGQKSTLPIRVQVPANAIKNQPVRLSFTVNKEDHVLSQTWQDIAVKAGIALINPEPYWPIDEALLGGINVAATAMGGQRTKEDLAFNVNSIGTGFDKLFDGYTALGLGMQYRGGRKSEQDYITIELAGDKLINVKGIILNPLSKVKPNLYLKDFDLHLSADGINFQSVLKGQLKSISAEQSFVLDKEIPAKFARLYLLNSHESRLKSNTGLGEWKVIASPLQSINEEGFNIADPKFGGHVSWAIPESSGNWDINLLTEKQEKAKARSTDDEDWQWVIGFHNQRAAKITKINLKQPHVSIPEKSTYELLKKVKIYVSRTTNVGPWEFIAEKELSSANEIDEIVFEKPTWARYVKFSSGNIRKRYYAYFPETIKIFEQKTGENYQSILGEWGELSENAIFERLNPPNYTKQLDDINNNSKNNAIDLSQIHKASGQVQLEMTDKPDWYKYKPKADDNTLLINLSGKQTIETFIQVEDGHGQNMSMIAVKNETNNIQYQIPVDASEEYYVKVEEPPRSVIFTWDTSGSTTAYQPMIYNAISNYSNDVIAGRDTVNFLPFGGNLLMKDWYGQPHYLKAILNNYNRLDNSSAAEKTLDKAAKALEKRQGSKSIIIITDAITGKHVEMWDNLKKVQPRIFSLGIIGNGFGGNPNRQIDLMQSWSRVNNGDFQKVVTAVEVEQAFDRVATKLRQPADYTLIINSEFIKAPGPGKLTITQDESDQSSAVELILDASGSMLKRLDGRRRINIAKEVLVKAVTEIIPVKTPVALRVFGDKEANACRTDLAMKLNPLDPNKAKKVINKIYAKNLAKTPIADSLAKVASDLKAHKGKKIVILVTDGEETCDGNPQEVIEKLHKDGIDIRLNIVGFAIDDEALKDQFNQWSVQGGGKYFDSNNPESLKRSVSHALKTPYSVYSISGELIKEGVVNGEALELPAGYYNIKVYGNKVETYENFHIKGESKQVIEL